MDTIDERSPELLCSDELLCTMPPGHVVTLEKAEDGTYVIRWYDCDEEKDRDVLPRKNLSSALSVFGIYAKHARIKSKADSRISNIDVDALKRDLSAVLRKYDASIFFTCGEGSDTYGLYDEAIEICDRETGRSLFRVNGWGLSAHDLKD